MTLDEAKKVVLKRMPALLRALGLGWWRVDVVWRKLDEGTKGECHMHPRYRRATIELDETEHDDADDLLHTLRHEALHVLHAEFAPLLDVARNLANTDEGRRLVACQWAESVERGVSALEVAFDCLGLRTVDDVIAASKGR